MKTTLGCQLRNARQRMLIIRDQISAMCKLPPEGSEERKIYEQERKAKFELMRRPEGRSRNRSEEGKAQMRFIKLRHKLRNHKGYTGAVLACIS